MRNVNMKVLSETTVCILKIVLFSSLFFFALAYISVSSSSCLSYSSSFCVIVPFSLPFVFHLLPAHSFFPSLNLSAFFNHYSPAFYQIFLVVPFPHLFFWGILIALPTAACLLFSINYIRFLHSSSLSFHASAHSFPLRSSFISSIFILPLSVSYASAEHSLLSFFTPSPLPQLFFCLFCCFSSLSPFLTCPYCLSFMLSTRFWFKKQNKLRTAICFWTPCDVGKMHGVKCKTLKIIILYLAATRLAQSRESNSDLRWNNVKRNFLSP